MDKPKEPGGRDEVGEDIDGLDLLPLVVDEPALDVGGEVLVQVVPAPPVASPPPKRKVVDHLATTEPPRKRGRGRPRKIIPVLIE